MTDKEDNNKGTEDNVTVEQESPTSSSNTEQSAGAEAQKPDADYSMILEAIKRIEDNQTRLAGQVAKISDAQSVLVDAGAVIHDDSAQVETVSGIDEFVPLEKLDLSI